jgi:hypothetical protein
LIAVDRRYVRRGIAGRGRAVQFVPDDGYRSGRMYVSLDNECLQKDREQGDQRRLGGGGSSQILFADGFCQTSP